MMLKHLKTALFLFLGLTMVTGVLYPLVVTGLAQLLFPRQANGSLIVQEGGPIGSSLIGQPFRDPRYFWGRPSATTPPYNAASSTGSNEGPLNPDLLKAVQARIRALREADPANRDPIPVDLVMSSASGLDPHISLAAARWQRARVARLRGLSEAEVQALIELHTTGRFLGLFGEPVVNVLELNLALDGRR